MYMMFGGLRELVEEQFRCRPLQDFLTSSSQRFSLSAHYISDTYTYALFMESFITGVHYKTGYQWHRSVIIRPLDLSFIQPLLFTGLILTVTPSHNGSRTENIWDKDARRIGSGCKDGLMCLCLPESARNWSKMERWYLVYWYRYSWLLQLSHPRRDLWGILSKR